MGLREIKDRARRALHKAMQVPAYYYAPGSSVPVPVNVRVHNSWAGVGDVQGTSFRFAEHRESVDEIIFLHDEIPEPVNKAIVVISATEGYRVNVLDPVYLQTQAAKVLPLTAKELLKYPGPDAGFVLSGVIVMPPLDGTPPDYSVPPVKIDGELMTFVMISGEIVPPVGE